MDLEKTKTMISDVWHIVFLIILVILLLGVLTWTGLVKCSQIPGWCDIYNPLYQLLTGKREVLIVYCNDGLGNAQLLQETLRNPSFVGVQATTSHISYIRQGNLEDFDMVIVTHCKTMSTKEMEYFLNFADNGGKLVWTGDAGTSLAKDDELLFKDDLDENALHEPIGVWARKRGENIVRLDVYISVNYLGNYCDLKACPAGSATRIGRLVPEPGADHPLIFGIAENLQLYGDFALVEEPESIGSKRVLSVDTGSNLILESGEELGQVFPVIVTTGLGEKVAYYAVPLEYFMQEPMGYSHLIEQLYKTFRGY